MKGSTTDSEFVCKMAGSSSCRSFTTDFREEKKQQTSPIKLTDRKRTFWSISPGSPLCKGTPYGRQKFRPKPSKSLATKRLRGSSARSLFSAETWDDTFETFPLVFTAQQLANVGECNVSSNSHNNYDPRAPQMSDLFILTIFIV